MPQPRTRGFVVLLLILIGLVFFLAWSIYLGLFIRQVVVDPSALLPLMLIGLALAFLFLGFVALVRLRR